MRGSVHAPEHRADLAGIASTGMSSVHDGSTMGHLIGRACARYRGRVAMVDATGSLRYEELGRMVATAASSLRRLGIGRGDAVAQLAGNSARAWAVQAAAYCLGARFVGLHEHGTVDDHRFLLADSAADVLVVDGNLHSVSDLDGPALRACLLHTDLFNGDDGDRLTTAEVAAAPGDIARLAYTGGTTGRPKGVMLSHRSLVTNTLMTMAQLPWPSSPTFISGAPITHGAGSYIVPVLLLGGTVVLMPRFSAGGFVEAVQRHRCTAAHAVPTMLYDLLDHLDGDARPIEWLQMIRYGAAPITLARLEQAIEVIGGHRLVQGYGQTEAPNTISFLSPTDHVIGAEQLTSAGAPYAGNEVAILDGDNRPVAAGEIGEICLRSPLVMDGYWQRPEETAAAFAGGWLHTGDIGREDDRGFLYIVDRAKDVVITGGFNVYPREIEDVLSRHPRIAEVAVVGAPDPRWGETLVAVVVCRPGARPAERELIDFVKQRKGSVAAPKRVEYLDALPRTAVGKPDKRALRATVTQRS